MKVKFEKFECLVVIDSSDLDDGHGGWALVDVQDTCGNSFFKEWLNSYGLEDHDRYTGDDRGDRSDYWDLFNDISYLINKQDFDTLQEAVDWIENTNCVNA